LMIVTPTNPILLIALILVIQGFFSNLLMTGWRNAHRIHPCFALIISLNPLQSEPLDEAVPQRDNEIGSEGIPPLVRHYLLLRCLGLRASPTAQLPTERHRRWPHFKSFVRKCVRPRR